MINWLSRHINCNRSATKILKVMSFSIIAQHQEEQGWMTVWAKFDLLWSPFDNFSHLFDDSQVRQLTGQGDGELIVENLCTIVAKLGLGECGDCAEMMTRSQDHKIKARWRSRVPGELLATFRLPQLERCKRRMRGKGGRPMRAGFEQGTFYW